MHKLTNEMAQQQIPIQNNNKQLQILKPMPLFREIKLVPQFLLYGDIPFDMELNQTRGMLFCQNSSFFGLKRCSRVVKTSNLLQFDLINQQPQLKDFQFLIDAIGRVDPGNSQENARNIIKLRDQLQIYQNMIKAEEFINKQQQIQQDCINNTCSQQFDSFKLENYFSAANSILLKETNPFFHYQIFCKTSQEFTAIRYGININGLKIFGIDDNIVGQSMLRSNFLPFNRDDTGALLALRSLQEMNIDYRFYARSGKTISQITPIKYQNMSISINQTSRIYELQDFQDQTECDSNIYLVIHTLNSDEIPKEVIQCILKDKINGKRDRNSNKDNNLVQMGLPSKRIRIENQPSSNDSFGDSCSSQQTKKQLESSPTQSATQSSEEHQISKKQYEDQKYSKKSNEFIAQFYDNSQEEARKKQLFDRAFENMLRKKQSKLLINLI